MYNIDVLLRANCLFKTIICFTISKKKSIKHFNIKIVNDVAYNILQISNVNFKFFFLFQVSHTFSNKLL